MGMKVGISLETEKKKMLRVFKNKILGRIFGPKKGVVTGECRKPQNEKLHILYISPNVFRVIK
jgi:hypothetical protein